MCASPGIDPNYANDPSLMDLKDPGGNAWLVQEVGQVAAED